MKLLLVDDEAYTRSGVETSIDWPAYGVTEIRTANDGRMGLEVARVFQPDILLTDVRMPFIMGVEMAQQIRVFQPKCQIIFMSGYSDKEYLMGAIKLASVAYVEKPLDLDEVAAAVSQAVALLQAEDQKANLIKHYDIALARQVAFDLTHQGEENLLHEQWHRLNAPGGPYQTLAVHSHVMQQRDLNMIQEIMQRYAAWSICAFSQDHTIAIHATALEPSRLHQACEELAAVHDDALVGVGSAVLESWQFKDSFHAALGSLEKSFFHPGQKVFCPCQTAAIDLSGADLRAFVDLMFDDRKLAEERLQSVLEHLRACDDTSISVLRHAAYWICKEAFTATPERLGHMVSDNSYHSLESMIDQAASLDELFQLIRMCIMVISPLDGVQMESRSIVRATQRYIDQHYSDCSLTISQLSGKMYLSPAYLCVLFKNETGETIKSYITRCRIDKAKQLLRTTRLHIQQIADACGFSNGNYFAKSFRHNTGMSPQDYRGRFDLL